MALTPRQERFVEEYVANGGNATQAAIAAGYSASTAKQQGSRLLTNADVADAIEAGRAQLTAKAEITAERWLEEVAALAFGSLADVVEWDDEGVRLKPSGDLTAEEKAALTALEFTVDELELEDGHVIRKIKAKAKQHSKVRALELLGDHLGLLKKRVEHTGSVGVTLSQLSRLAEGAGEAEDPPPPAHGDRDTRDT